MTRWTPSRWSTKPWPPTGIGGLDTDDGYLARLAEAGLLLRTGHSAEAEKRYSEILEHFRSVGRGESKHALLAWDDLALSISDQGRWAEACDLWRQLNAVDRKVFGDNHPYTMMTLTNIGTALDHLQRYDEAETVLVRLDGDRTQDLRARPSDAAHQHE